MALLKEESYTIEDIYALPDGERAELIDGHIYYMAPPSYKHQKLVMELSAIIRNYIKQHKGTCEVLPAPFAVYLDEINNTYVEPDISVICDPNKLDVDIAKNRITVYNFNHDYSIEEYSFTDTVKAGIYEDLSIDFSEINIL